MTYKVFALVIVLSQLVGSIVAGIQSPEESDCTVFVRWDFTADVDPQEVDVSDLSIVSQEEALLFALTSERGLERLQDQGAKIEVLKSYCDNGEEVNDTDRVNDVTLSNEYIAITIADTGNFTIQRAGDNAALLYPNPLTTLISLRVDNKVYSHIDGLTVETPLTKVDNKTAFIEYATNEGVVFRQTFSLAERAVGLGMKAFNRGSQAHQIQVRYLLDTQVGENDGSPLFAQGVTDSQGSNIITYETNIPLVTFREWKSYDKWPSPALSGVGTLSTIPSRMVFAYWPEASASRWDYTPDPGRRFFTPGYYTFPESDSSVLLYLDLGRLAVNESKSLTSYYGTGAPGGQDTEVARLTDALKVLRGSLLQKYRGDAGRLASIMAESTYVLFQKPDSPEVKLLKEALNLEELASSLENRNFLEKELGTEITNETYSQLVDTGVASMVGSASGHFIDGSQELPRVEKERRQDLANSYSELLYKVYDVGENRPPGLPVLSRSNLPAYTTYYEEWLLEGDSGARPGFSLVTVVWKDLVEKIDAKIKALEDGGALPENYPVDLVIDNVSRSAEAIQNSASEETILSWYDVSQKAFQLKMYGKLYHNPAVDEIYQDMNAEDETVSMLSWAGNQSAIRSFMPLGESIGGYGGVVTDGLGEVAIWSDPAAQSRINEAQELKGQMYALQSTISAANNLLDEVDLSQQVVGDSLAMIDDAKIRPRVYNEADAVVKGLHINDVVVPGGVDVGRAIGTLNVDSNSDYDNKVRYLFVVRGTAADKPQIVTIAANNVGSLGEEIVDLPEIPANSSKVFRFEYQAPTSATLNDLQRYRLGGYIGVGPALITTHGTDPGNFYVAEGDVAGQIEKQGDNAVISGRILAGQEIERYVDKSFVEDAEKVRFMLTFAHGDLDLHVYDGNDRHIGVNYETGQIETQIPGGAYVQGPIGRPESIVIENPGETDYRVEVTAVSVPQYGGGSGSGLDFDVTTTAVPYYGPTLAVNPSRFHERTDMGSPVTLTLWAREIGGQEAYHALGASTESFVSGDCVIPGNEIDITLEQDSIQPYDSTKISVTISPPEDLPDGIYTGDIVVGNERIKVPVTIEYVGHTQYLPFVSGGRGAYRQVDSVGTRPWCDPQRVNQKPDVPVDPSPAQSANNIDPDTNLSWYGSDPDGDLLTFNVYLAKNNNSPGNLVCRGVTNMNCNPGPLDEFSRYYWRVVSIDESGEFTEAPVWSFYTGERRNENPYTPSNPSPTHTAEDIRTNVTLSWSGGDPDGDNVSYEVYLEAGDTTPDDLVCPAYGSTSCNPGLLEENKKYYWKVVATDEYGQEREGPVWNFKTEGGPPPPPPLPDGPWETVGNSASGGGISNNGGDSGFPLIAVSPTNSKPVVAWHDNSAGDYEIYVKAWNGSSWQTVGSGSASGGGISSNSGQSQYPYVAIAPDGKPYVAWVDNSSGKFQIYLKYWNGSSWQALGGSASGGGLSNSPTSARSPLMTIGPDGRPYVGYRDNSNGNYEIYLKYWNGSSWQQLGGSASGGGISKNSGFSGRSFVSVAPNGKVCVSWQDSTPGDWEIYLKCLSGSSWLPLGNSASGGGISNNGGDSLHNTMALDSNGYPVIAWYDNSAGDNEIYLKRWNGSSWAAVGGSASGGGISNNSSDSIRPAIVIDSADRIHLTWRDMNGGNMEIYSKYWNGSSWVLHQSGSASGGGISMNPGASEWPPMAIGPDNVPYVTWMDKSSGDYEIYVKRWR